MLTATEIACAIRRRDVSVVDVIDAQLDRIANFNRALNAVVTLDAEGARRRAVEADRVLADGRSWGPLHGVPVTIKDSFDTAGLRTTSGYRSFAQRVPARDATAVGRLRAAGAIIVGKTNLPSLASGIQSDNAVFGRTNNPWDAGRTPGGSSGGAAAAIAAGLSALELGSDIGGSIRIPAHFCGVFALKATAGRVSGNGHVASARRLEIPAGFAPLLQLASFGPIARSIDDLQLALAILAEPGTPPLGDSTRRVPSELRLAWTEDFGGAPLDADSRARMRQLAAQLAKGGVQVDTVVDTPFDYRNAWHVAGICLGAANTLFQSPASRWIRKLASPLLRSVGPRHPLEQGLFAGMSLRRDRIVRALEARDQLIEQLERFLGRWDAWICPVFPVPAFSHRRTNVRIDVDGAPMSQLKANLLHSILFNLTGHPVVTIPIGFSREGLPIGIQVVGRRWDEMGLLEVARSIASAAGAYRPPPGY